MLKLLGSYLDPEKIILFGSRAKGKENKSSDFDFAVDTSIANKKDKLIAIQDKLDEISGLYKIDIVFFK